MKTATVEVFHIEMPKEKLRAMPSEERGYLLSLGYAVNQVQMLQKLAMLSLAHEGATETEKILSGAQSQMILRLLIGMLHEAWDLIRVVTVSQLWRDYEARVDGGGRDALAKLQSAFAPPSLLTIIRNNFSFHPPNNKVLDKAFTYAVNDPNSDGLWSIYFSQHGFNSLYLASDLMAVHGIKQVTREQGMVEAQELLMTTVVDVCANVFEFTKAYFAAAWIKHFGATFDAKEVIKVTVPAGVEGISIPFFLDMSVPA